MFARVKVDTKEAIKQRIIVPANGLVDIHMTKEWLNSLSEDEADCLASYVKAVDVVSQDSKNGHKTKTKHVPVLVGCFDDLSGLKKWLEERVEEVRIKEDEREKMILKYLNKGTKNIIHESSISVTADPHFGGILVSYNGLRVAQNSIPFPLHDDPRVQRMIMDAKNIVNTHNAPLEKKALEESAELKKKLNLQYDEQRAKEKQEQEEIEAGFRKWMSDNLPELMERYKENLLPEKELLAKVTERVFEFFGHDFTVFRGKQFIRPVSCGCGGGGYGDVEICEFEGTRRGITSEEFGTLKRIRKLFNHGDAAVEVISYVKGCRTCYSSGIPDGEIVVNVARVTLEFYNFVLLREYVLNPNTSHILTSLSDSKNKQ